MWKKFNLVLLICPILIFSLSYITLLSTSEERARTHLGFFLIGLAFYILFAFIDYKIYQTYWKPIYIATVVLLALTYIAGQIKFGASRWFSVAGVAFQPAEFAKITTIIVMSTIIAQNKYIYGNFRTIKENILKFIGLAALALPLIILVFLQPDLGTAVTLLAVVVSMLYYSGVNKIYFLIAILIFGILSAPAWNILRDYQKQRILIFLNPALDTQGSGYNVVQSIIAIGSSGIFGKGFGNGTQTHLNFLPAYWTDFIFASYAEEWGLIGIIMALTLYLTLISTLIYVAYKGKNAAASLIVIGIFTIFFVQLVINIGMNLGIMPVKGIPLPLFSYGGSSMISTMIMLGLAQNICRE